MLMEKGMEHYRYKRMRLEELEKKKHKQA